MERIPFDKKELEIVEVIPATVPGRPDAKIFNYPIPPKENYRLVYERKIPFWLPTRNDTRMITPRIDPDNLARVFAFEAEPMKPEEMTGQADKFGIPWVFVPQVGGSMVEPGNPALKDANDWQEAIQFPDVANWDWAGSKEANKDFVKTDRWFVYCHLTGFFERLISFMDFENAAVALVDDEQKDAVHSLFDALADCYIDIFTRAYDAYGFDSLNFHDDWGSQRAPFFSLDLVMEMVVPHIKKVTDFVHNELGIYFDMHSCGKNELLVPAYIAAGADSWSGQPMNDKPLVYSKYGDQLILGIEPQVPADATQPTTAMPLEEAIAIGQSFLDAYIPNYAEKPVFASMFAGPDGYDEFMYESSRNAFNKLAG